MKKDYLGNNRLLPAYNLQLGAADEYIAVSECEPLPCGYGLLRAAEGDIPRSVQTIKKDTEAKCFLLAPFGILLVVEGFSAFFIPYLFFCYTKGTVIERFHVLSQSP